MSLTNDMGGSRQKYKSEPIIIELEFLFRKRVSSIGKT